MKIEATYSVKAPQEKVWALLQDRQALAKCIPGCDALEPVGPSSYVATIRVGIAAVKGTYRAAVQLIDPRPMNEYHLRVEGQSGANYVKGEALIRLSANGGQTRVIVSGQAELGGSLASVGQRLAPGVAKLLMSQFFNHLKKLAEAGGDKLPIPSPDNTDV
jgi:carbon monoxide dehydrogenase subunit G